MALLPERVLIWGTADFNELVNEVDWLDIRSLQPLATQIALPVAWICLRVCQVCPEGSWHRTRCQHKQLLCNTMALVRRAHTQARTQDSLLSALSTPSDMHSVNERTYKIHFYSVHRIYAFNSINRSQRQTKYNSQRNRVHLCRVSPTVLSDTSKQQAPLFSITPPITNQQLESHLHEDSNIPIWNRTQVSESSSCKSLIVTVHSDARNFILYPRSYFPFLGF